MVFYYCRRNRPHHAQIVYKSRKTVLSQCQELSVGWCLSPCVPVALSEFHASPGSNPVLGSRYQFSYLTSYGTLEPTKARALKRCVVHVRCVGGWQGSQRMTLCENSGGSQLLKGLATLSEDQSLMPGAHARHCNCPVTPGPGAQTPSTCAHQHLHIYTDRHINN